MNKIELLWELDKLIRKEKDPLNKRNLKTARRYLTEAL